MKINGFGLKRRIGLCHYDSAIAAIVTTMFAIPAAAASSAPAPFSTFLQDKATLQGIGHDAAGNIYVVGTVNNSPVPGHTSDIFAARFDPNATQAAYFVYLAGAGPNIVRAMAVDAQGNTYITGYTGASSFPVTSGFSGPVPSGVGCPFALKLNSSGAVVYASLFAGAVNANPQAIAVDSGGNVIITGAASQGYPVTSGAISVSGYTLADGNYEPFVTKLDPSGTTILFSDVGVGGSQIVLGALGDIFVSGNASSLSATYPTTPGAFQTTYTTSNFCTAAPSGQCFPADEQYVTHLSADGTQLIYSTFITGSGGATNSGLAVDSSGNAYVTGSSGSKDYPITSTAAGDRSGLFLTKLNRAGSNVLWSVRQGGDLLGLDNSGNPVVGGSFVPVTGPAGSSSAASFPFPPPTGSSPAQCLPNGATVQSVAYVQSFGAQDGSTAVTQLLSATQATTSAMAVEPDGRILLAGFTYFPDVPLTPGVAFSDAAEQPTAPGAFLAAFDLSQPAAAVQLSCVTDAATIMPVGPVAPGQLLTLYGSGLGPQAGVAASTAGQTSFPTSLANVQVAFDGIPAPMLYVSFTQVNVQVPFQVAQNAPAFTVMTISIAPSAGGAFAPVATRMFAVAASNPSVFLDTSASPGSCDLRLANTLAFAAVALNSDGSRNACDHPAKLGSAVTVFLNGVAAMLGTSFPGTGSITSPTPDPFASQVDAVSLASGPLFPVPGSIAGVDQVVIQLPATAANGAQEVYLEMAVNGVQVGPFEAYTGILYQQPMIVWVEQ